MQPDSDTNRTKINASGTAGRILKEIPAFAKDLHSSTEDNSQIVGTINMPQKINLTAIKGNWALVSVFDIDKTPKTGYVRWRSDNGIKYYFPDIK